MAIQTILRHGETRKTIKPIKFTRMRLFALNWDDGYGFAGGEEDPVFLHKIDALLAEAGDDGPMLYKRLSEEAFVLPEIGDMILVADVFTNGIRGLRAGAWIPEQSLTALRQAFGQLIQR